MADKDLSDEMTVSKMETAAHRSRAHHRQRCTTNIVLRLLTALLCGFCRAVVSRDYRSIHTAYRNLHCEVAMLWGFEMAQCGSALFDTSTSGSAAAKPMTLSSRASVLCFWMAGGICHALPQHLMYSSPPPNGMWSSPWLRCRRVFPC